jgi:ornithine cyclodeaminase
MSRRAPGFSVIGAAIVRAILAEHGDAVFGIVRDTYRAHHAGRSINPDSYFLKFPDRPDARIIALPARLDDGADTAAIKWISSFPGNHAHALPRASAVVVLNDMATGFPYACLEGGQISAARTAASAALAAELLHPQRQAERVAVIGAGPIAAAVVGMLRQRGWDFGGFAVHDLVPVRAEAFCAVLARDGNEAVRVRTAAAAIDGADLLVLATTAAQPHLLDAGLFSPRQTVLHVSLRDLGVNVVLSAQNVVDDIEHCLKAQTSVHLAEQETRSRAFVAGTIGDLLADRLQPDRSRARVFSPFGLGVLDLAVARFVHDTAVRSGRVLPIGDFFAVA